MTRQSPAVTRLCADLIAELEAVCAARTRELVTEALGRIGPLARPSAKVLPFARPRRKAPVQLCPSPGCKNRAAPAFGMLCGEHKGAPAATVKAWREQRRARKGR